MIKVLRVDNNLNYAQKILNEVLSKIPEINVKYIVTTVHETIEVLRKEEITLILLSSQLQDGTSFDVIKQIKAMNFISEPDIIMISENMHTYNQSVKNQPIFVKTQTGKNIQKTIQNYVYTRKNENEKKQIKDKIISEIKNIGYNFKYIGTIYIIESILYIYMSNNLELLDNLENNVYKYVAFKYQKSLNNIKTNIVKATMKINRNSQIGFDYTPKLVISDVVVRILNNSV